jgi:hypothetical protein
VLLLSLAIASPATVTEKLSRFDNHWFVSVTVNQAFKGEVLTSWWRHPTAQRPQCKDNIKLGCCMVKYKTIPNRTRKHMGLIRKYKGIQF